MSDELSVNNWTLAAVINFRNERKQLLQSQDIDILSFLVEEVEKELNRRDFLRLHGLRHRGQPLRHFRPKLRVEHMGVTFEYLMVHIAEEAELLPEIRVDLLEQLDEVAKRLVPLLRENPHELLQRIEHLDEEPHLVHVLPRIYLYFVEEGVRVVEGEG